MTQPFVEPDDHAVRVAALDPLRSFIVQAPAGSGKTELLIRRFLVLLGRVRQPEEVVAITFTRKAAAEMRERVIDALIDAASPDAPTDPNRRARRELAMAALANDRRQGWRLTDHPARLRIQTIDALCAALTRQMPWLSRSGAALQVCEDADELYADAALDTLRLLAGTDRDWAQAASVLLQHVDNQVARARELLVDMLRHRDQWLRHVAGTGGDPQARRTVLEQAWAKAVRRDLQAAAERFPEALKTELVACARYAADTLVDQESDSPIRECHIEAFPRAEPFALPVWRGLVALILRTDGAVRQQVNRRQGFPANRNREAEAMRERMLGLLAAIASDQRLHEALMRVQRLPEPVYSEQQWRILDALTRLLPVAAARLHMLFTDRGEVDFAEIARRANLALGDLDNPSELALRLDYRMQHLLVDEFQDTSVTQFALLERLTAGWGAEEDRTVFLVGDPMQSIYRFREAEVGLFLRVCERGLGSLRPQPLRLTANFRSQPALVDWANQAFARAFPAVVDAGRGAVPYAPATATRSTKGRSVIQLHALIDDDGSEEARRVVNIIAQTRASEPDAQIAVLVRSRSHLRHILPALTAAGAEFRGIEIERLTLRPVVQDLWSLTRALLRPADRIAWLAVLRAPWCGATLSELYTLTSAAGEHCLCDVIGDEPSLARLGQPGRDRIRRVAGVLRNALAQRGRGTLRQWVEHTWLELGGPACGTAQDVDNAGGFFDLLAARERSSELDDLPRFGAALEALWAHAEAPADSGLQVMTLHKAKGLEFDTVIIPGLDRQPRSEEAKLFLWEEDSDAARDSLLLAPLAPAGPERDAHYDNLRRLRTEKAMHENLRLLYVGCTRARRNLHLLGCARVGSNGQLRTPAADSLLACIWPQVVPEFDRVRAGQMELFGARADAAAPGPPVLRRLPEGWSPPEPPGLAYPRVQHLSPVSADREPVEYDWAGEAARLVGLVVHEFLLRFARDGIEQWSAARLLHFRDRWRQTLAAWGATDDELDEAVSRIERTLRTALGDPRAVWLFHPHHTEVGNEYALSSVIEGRLRRYRIDRTFVDPENVRWIVDYKSSDHRGGGVDAFLDRERERYRAQLEGYARLIAHADPRPIRLGLYFPMLQGWREWAYDPVRSGDG